MSTKSTPRATERKAEAEIWKDLPGFEGKYQVSNLGRVKSLKRTRWNGYVYQQVPEKIKKQTPMYKNNPRSYLVTGLSAGLGVFFIHRLVLLTFVGPCPEGMECRHLDGDCRNNRLENLCWGTRKENAADKKRHGTENKGEVNGSAKLTEKAVLEIRKRYDPKKKNMPELARAYGVKLITIWKAVHRHTWTHI